MSLFIIRTLFNCSENYILFITIETIFITQFPTKCKHIIIFYIFCGDNSVLAKVNKHSINRLTTATADIVQNVHVYICTISRLCTYVIFCIFNEHLVMTRFILISNIFDSTQLNAVGNLQFYVDILKYKYVYIYICIYIISTYSM